PRRRGRRGLRCLADRLPRRRDHGDDVPHRHRLPLCDRDLPQHAVGAGDQLHHRFVGLDLGERLPRLHCVAVPLMPLHQAPFLHGRGERFHEDLGGHDQSRYSTRRAAATSCSAALSATATVLEWQIRVTSWPVRLTSAWPIGTTYSPSGTSPLMLYNISPSSTITGLSSRIAALSRPLASAGVAGATTLRPG